MKIICIGGNIGAGKSTLINNLANCGYPIIREDINLWQPTFDNSLRDPSKWYFANQMNIMLTQHTQYLKALQSVPENCTLIIERSPECCLFFSEIAKRIGIISSEEFSVIEKLYNIIKWQPYVYIYLNTPVHTCLDRIKKRGRLFESKITLDYLVALDSYFGSKPAMFLDGLLNSEDLLTQCKDLFKSLNITPTE